VARGNSAFSLLATMLSSLVLSILLPTSSGRTAVLAPICDGMARIMDDASDGQLGDPRRRGNLARSMFIALSFVSNATGVAVITGSSASTYAAGISPELFGYTWDYTSWAIVFLPGTVLFILLLWVGLLLLFRPEWHDVPGGVPYVAAARIALGPMNLPEWKTTLWLAAVVLGWITVPLHNLPIPMVAMMGTIGLCLPYLGVLTWEGAIRGVEWDVILMFCGGFSMALALESSGAATWIATSVADSLSHPTPLMAALALLAVSSLVRVAFVNMVAMMAMMLPVVVRIAAIWEISAVWLSLFAMVGVTFGFFLLSQTSSNAITYAYRRYSLGDLATAGTMALAISWVITLGLAFTLWPILGFHP